MKHTRNKVRRQGKDLLFDIVLYSICAVLLLLVLYPLWFIVIASFSDPSAVAGGHVWLWPVGFTLDGYDELFRQAEVWTGYRNTIVYTVLGTIFGLMVNIPAAYALSRKDLWGRRGLMGLYVFTMFFSGGMIPTYLVVSKLKLIDSFWAMILPSAMGVWNVILIKTYIQSSIPSEIFESAAIDGCSDWKYFINMVIPLAKPIIAVMVLLYAVGKWNDFFSALLYLNDVNKQPLQLLLRNILVQNDSIGMAMNLAQQMSRQELKTQLQYSLIIVSSVPVMILYPFIQKYFVKGIMMGSIKG